MTKRSVMHMTFSHCSAKATGMEFAFDLWDYNDVCTNAHDILERLSDGSMPCDDEWPEEQINQFQNWMDAGMPA